MWTLHLIARFRFCVWLFPFNLLLHKHMFEVVDQKWNFTTKRLFPFISSKIPAALAIEVNSFHLKLYFRACGSYHGLLNRVLLLTRKLLDHGFLVVNLKSSLPMLYGRRHYHINHYGVSVSQMITDMFYSWLWQSWSFLIHVLSPVL